MAIETDELGFEAAAPLGHPGRAGLFPSLKLELAARARARRSG